MKSSGNKNIKAVLVRFFICVFAVLAVTAFICGIEYSGDKSYFRMTGKHYDTVSLQGAEDYFRSFIKNYTE